MLRRQRVPQTMLLRGESLGSGVTFGINDHASFSVEGGYPADRKYILSWFIADRSMNTSLPLPF